MPPGYGLRSRRSKDFTGQARKPGGNILILPSLLRGKTGTSFGFRDAWAVGTNPEYTVGVWVGNADGEGRPGLQGRRWPRPYFSTCFHYCPASPGFNSPSGNEGDKGLSA